MINRDELQKNTTPESVDDYLEDVYFIRRNLPNLEGTDEELLKLEQAIKGLAIEYVEREMVEKTGQIEPIVITNGFNYEKPLEDSVRGDFRNVYSILNSFEHVKDIKNLKSIVEANFNNLDGKSIDDYINNARIVDLNIKYDNAGYDTGSITNPRIPSISKEEFLNNNYERTLYNLNKELERTE